MTSEISNPKSEIQNPKSIVVRNAAGLTRRARKSELKWFADRGFSEVGPPLAGAPSSPNLNPKSAIQNPK